jgi:hypothetical protein
MPRPTPGTPRWPTLGGLGAVVLGLHLWLLGAAPTDWSATAPQSPLLSDPEPASASATTPPTAASVAPAVQPVSVSQVRWISPATPVPTQPAPTPAPQRREPVPATRAPTGLAAAPTPEPAPPALPPATESSPPPAATAAIEEPPLASTTQTSGPTETAQVQLEPRPALIQSGAANAQALPPARVPASTQLDYEVQGRVRGLVYTAQAELNWTQADGRYDARMSVRLPLLGSRVQTSTGRVQASGLLPERFADKARSERAAHFDHDLGRIRFSANTPDAELLPGAQDRLSLFLQLSSRLEADPASLPAGQVIELQVAGTSTAESWYFRVADEEILSLPSGELRARRLVRETRQPRDTQVELWLAPSLGHLPVRIRLVQDNGDQIDQQLSRLP